MTFAQVTHAAAANYLRQLLEDTRGNMTQAAKLAGVHRSRLYRLCARFGVGYVRGKPRSTLPSMASLPAPGGS